MRANDPLAPPSSEEEEADDNSDGVICTVCHSSVRPGEFARTIRRCGHTFHVECIAKWLCNHTRCPSCMQDIRVAPPPADSPADPPAADPLAAAANAPVAANPASILSSAEEEVEDGFATPSATAATAATAATTVPVRVVYQLEDEIF